jgi:hypothetical protein
LGGILDASICRRTLPINLLSLVSTIPLVFLSIILLLARIGSLRDEEDNWSLEFVGQRFREGLGALWDSTTGFFTAPFSEKLKVIGKTLAVTSMLVLSILNIVRFLLALLQELVESRDRILTGIAEDTATATWAFAVLFIFSIFLIFLGWWQGRGSELGQAIKATKTHRQYGAPFVSWPPVIDCNHDDVKGLAALVPDPVLSRLLVALADWKPKRRFTQESEYQADLASHLRHKMPGIAEREVPVGNRSNGTEGRADFIIGEHVLIEMKRRLTKQTADKALGQVQRYCEAWPEKTILLLLCDTQINDSNRFIVQEFHRIQQRAQVSIVVARGLSREEKAPAEADRWLWVSESVDEKRPRVPPVGECWFRERAFTARVREAYKNRCAFTDESFLHLSKPRKPRPSGRGGSGLDLRSSSNWSYPREARGHLQARP